MRVRKSDLYRKAVVAGLSIGEWSPGDGATRYRIIDKPHPNGIGDFHEGDGIYTALGVGEAHIYLAAYIRGMASGRKPDWNAVPANLVNA